MAQTSGDIITVPHAEIDDIDPLVAAFGALAEEDGDPDRMIGRREMIVDMISTFRLFAADDVDMVSPIITVQLPATGMPMGMLEDLCDVALEYDARSRGQSAPTPHEAWDFRRVLDAVHLRPVAG